jgi:hypothetical protein
MSDGLTGEVPWIELVDVDVGDDRDGARRGGGAVAEVVQDELLVRGVEPEPRRQLRRRRLRRGDHLHLHIYIYIYRPQLRRSATSTSC